MASDQDERFMQRIADVDLAAPEPAPSRLKARVYSALLQRQVETGPLASLTESHCSGHELCVFEQLVRISPVGETAKSLNICRMCHARVLAEHMDNSPIYWSGCPYVALKNP
jgi:hypothetical protein